MSLVILYIAKHHTFGQEHISYLDPSNINLMCGTCSGGKAKVKCKTTSVYENTRSVQSVIQQMLEGRLFDDLYTITTLTVHITYTSGISGYSGSLFPVREGKI